jgi:hypothetical protein
MAERERVHLLCSCPVLRTPSDRTHAMDGSWDESAGPLTAMRCFGCFALLCGGGGVRACVRACVRVVQFKYSSVWGTSAKHCPQRVGLKHDLHDEDVIQLMKK